MAAVPYITNTERSRVKTTTWTALTATNDSGQPEHSLDDFADKTIQVKGTFNGATVNIQGSNDGGTTYWALHDLQGDEIAITTAGGTLIAENPALIRPFTSGGGGSQSLTVILVSRK